MYTIGGAVSGLGTATGLVLQNNGGDDLPIAGDGPFTFIAAHVIEVGIPRRLLHVIADRAR
jgi:hypothetical protein